MHDSVRRKGHRQTWQRLFHPLRLLIALLLVVGLGWTTFLGPARVTAALAANAPIVVNTNADTIDATEKACTVLNISDLPGGGDGKISLREAICAANNTAGDDIITFSLPANSTITIQDPFSDYYISSNIAINGPTGGVTISGARKAQVFLVGGPAISPTVSMSNLTIRDGNGSNGNGGAILNYGDLSLTDVTVTQSDAPGFFSGGGIANVGTLTLLRTTVSANGGYNGGGIANFGSATLTDSTVTTNEGSYGAGMYSGPMPDLLRPVSTAAAINPTLHLIRTTVSENGCSNAAETCDNQSLTAINGGGIAVTAGTALIEQSTITDNLACRGGGISNTASTTVTGSTISTNHSDPTTECFIGGGGVYNNGTFSATNSTFSGNSSFTDGGGIFTASNASLQLSFATVTLNTANNGGGIYVFIPDFLVAAAVGATFNNSIVAGNSGEDPTQRDCSGPLTSGGHNLVGSATGCPANGSGDLTTTNISAVLDTTLNNNGGPTKTHALTAASPALNAADPALCGAAGGTPTDQRLTPRPQGPGCDIGAYERAVVAAVTLTVQVDGNGTVAASPAPLSSSGTPASMTYTYAPGTVVTLTVIYDSDTQVFARWLIDGTGALPYGRGWANPLSITMDTSHTATATIVPRPNFTDLPRGSVAYTPATELAARGIVVGFTQQGCDTLQPPVSVPCYGPGQPTARVETALFLTRLLGLAGEDHGNGGFSDVGGLSPTTQRAVGTMAYYGIMQGYTDGRFGAGETITYTEFILVVSRAMVFKGYWTRATVDDPSIYPNLNFGPQMRLDLVTFVQNAGNLPDFANDTPRAPADRPAPRDWSARVLWQSLGAYFSIDQSGKGGYVP